MGDARELVGFSSASVTLRIFECKEEFPAPAINEGRCRTVEQTLSSLRQRLESVAVHTITARLATQSMTLMSTTRSLTRGNRRLGFRMCGRDDVAFDNPCRPISGVGVEVAVLDNGVFVGLG